MYIVHCTRQGMAECSDSWQLLPVCFATFWKSTLTQSQAECAAEIRSGIANGFLTVADSAWTISSEISRRKKILVVVSTGRTQFMANLCESSYSNRRTELGAREAKLQDEDMRYRQFVQNRPEVPNMDMSSVRQIPCTETLFVLMEIKLRIKFETQNRKHLKCRKHVHILLFYVFQNCFNYSLQKSPVASDHRSFALKWFWVIKYKFQYDKRFNWCATTWRLVAQMSVSKKNKPRFWFRGERWKRINE